MQVKESCVVAGRGYSLEQNVKLRVKTVEEAEHALATCEAECPGSYMECFGNRSREQARILWLERLHLCRYHLDLANSFARAERTAL